MLDSLCSAEEFLDVLYSLAYFITLAEYAVLRYPDNAEYVHFLFRQRPPTIDNSAQQAKIDVALSKNYFSKFRRYVLKYYSVGLVWT